VNEETRGKERKDGLPARTPLAKMPTEDCPLKTGSSKAGSGSSSEEGGKADRELNA